ncbi:MAG: excinuclease ABC subunit UvrA [Granulosicoccaceae bacterium]
MDSISIRGARTHNLKNIDLDLPRNKLIVITGLSGSGKSSLAFDTIFAEGQRRYVESLSAYARQFLSVMEKPDVDHIEGLSPAIAIEQKSTSHNPRSTVGTITEIHDYLRLLYARVGTPRCPDHGEPLSAQTVSQMVDATVALPDDSRHMVLAPLVMDRKGEHQGIFESLQIQGFVRVRVDGEVLDLHDSIRLDPKKRHRIEVVVDRFKVREGIEQRLAESFETALGLSDGTAFVAPIDADGDELVFSSRFACPLCGYAISELEPRMFSFNSPQGACESCDGIGHEQYFDPTRVVGSPTLSLAAGAVRGWDRRNAYYFQMISALAEHYAFDLDTPFDELNEEARQVVLYGSGEEKIQFAFVNERGNKRESEGPFEGVIPNLKRRFRETQSAAVREELSKLLSERPCDTCKGERLNTAARHVEIGDVTLPTLANMAIGDAQHHLANLELSGKRAEVASKILKELHQRMQFLINVGLDYLTFSRTANTLSGGEAQRIRLASQIGAGLSGVMYVLDEPSIGLHQRDNDRLLATLTNLRDLQNTVIVVEHDEDAIRSADYVVDIGPGAGAHGGEIVATGCPDDILNNKNSITGSYLRGDLRISRPNEHRKGSGKCISIEGASGNNLHDISIDIPLGKLVCVTGVSGSGKSTLINDTLYTYVARELNRASTPSAPVKSIAGLQHIDKIVDIDQSPIGRTPRSNPATYTGLFAPIRELFAGTQESRTRGYTSGRFSFNVKGGRCEACQGDGVTRVEMHFLPDVFVPCDVCHGARYNRETLDIKYKGKTIADVLQLTVEDALAFFDAVPVVKRKLDTLQGVGLSYITLGQNATTLSGGEAQRVKLAKELSKRDTGNTLYILDEPTTGLHFHDVEQLMQVLNKLADQGNSIVIIEHNLDVIRSADWIIDLGPEGGAGGGSIVGVGTPEDLCKIPGSYTGKYLAAMDK